MSKQPEYINGYWVRPREGRCPSCLAAEKEWCLSHCVRLDPMDYR